MLSRSNTPCPLGHRVLDASKSKTRVPDNVNNFCVFQIRDIHIAEFCLRIAFPCQTPAIPHAFRAFNLWNERSRHMTRDAVCMDIVATMQCELQTWGKWQQRDSNSQPSDLESDALPLRHAATWKSIIISSHKQRKSVRSSCYGFCLWNIFWIREYLPP